MSEEPEPVEVLRLRVAELESENEALRREADELDHQLHQAEVELEEYSRDWQESEVELEEVGELRQQVDELSEEVRSLSEANDELEGARQLVDHVDASGEARGGSASDEERHYVGSKQRRHFHRPTCKWAQYISDYLLIEFGSHHEAVEAGYRPCKTCRA